MYRDKPAGLVLMQTRALFEQEQRHRRRTVAMERHLSMALKRCAVFRTQLRRHLFKIELTFISGKPLLRMFSQTLGW